MSATRAASRTAESTFGRFGLALAEWSERWFPDPLVFALLGIVVVFVFGLLLRESPANLAVQGGKNFWALVPFTMQMVMVIIGGYVVATTPLVYRGIRALAGMPKTSPRRHRDGGLSVHADLADLLGAKPDFQRRLVRELSHRVKGMDYRAAGAAAYLGLGRGVGAGPLLVGGHDDGHQNCDSLLRCSTSLALSRCARPFSCGRAW